MYLEIDYFIDFLLSSFYIVEKKKNNFFLKIKLIKF
jgi:hypothetical protein